MAAESYSSTDKGIILFTASKSNRLGIGVVQYKVDRMVHRALSFHKKDMVRELRRNNCGALSADPQHLPPEAVALLCLKVGPAQKRRTI